MAACVRTAWLTLGTATLPLENPAAGYFCTALDLGSPDVRAVTTANPDRDGLTDRTQYMGGRVVEADVTALRGAGAQVDAVAALFAPYMVPNVRPVLHYVLDRPGAPERTLVLRGADYAFKISGPEERDIVLQWVAADPIARDPATHTAYSFAGTGAGVGRIYNLVFPRVYPAGTQAATTATVSTPGDVPARPLVRIYGPVTAPLVHTNVTVGGAPTVRDFVFTASTRIDAGHWVDIDHDAHTVYRDSDPAQNLIASVDWSKSAWLTVPPAPSSATLTLQGASTSPISQLAVSWQDGYLT